MMNCQNCVYWWTDINNIWPTCHADPNWPAPCEYDDETEDEEDL